MSVFQVKVQFIVLNGGQKGQAQSIRIIFTELFFEDVVDLVLSDQITISRVFGFKAKSFARQNSS